MRRGGAGAGGLTVSAGGGRRVFKCCREDPVRSVLKIYELFFLHRRKTVFSFSAWTKKNRDSLINTLPCLNIKVVVCIRVSFVRAPPPRPCAIIWYMRTSTLL